MQVLEVMVSALGNFKKEGNAKYKFTCPSCNSFSLCVNPLKDGGPFICNACGLTGNAYKIARGMGLNVELGLIPVVPPKDQSILTKIYTKVLEVSTLRDYHALWLLKRGILPNVSMVSNKYSMVVRSSDLLLSKLEDLFTDDELIYAGLLVESKGQLIASPVIQQNRILIPYFNLKGECVYIRSRYAGHTEKFRYASPNGVPSKHFSWGWDSFSGAKCIGVTEGEIKAQAMRQLGYDWIGLIGMNTGHADFARKCRDLGIINVYIMFDRDNGLTSAGICKQDGVDSATCSLARSLGAEDINSYNCLLPIEATELKVDIDSFVLKEGVNARQKIHDCVLQSQLIYEEVS